MGLPGQGECEEAVACHISCGWSPALGDGVDLGREREESSGCASRDVIGQTVVTET